MRGKNWTTTELSRAARLWKRGDTIDQMAIFLDRTRESIKHQVQSRRDYFPRRKTPKSDLREVTNLKIAISPYTYSLVKAEARERGISMNMLIRETFTHRFVRKTWKLPESTSIAKVKYSTGSKDV